MNWQVTDPQIKAAIIGAVATVVAALIGYYAVRRGGRQRAYRERWYTRWQFGQKVYHETLDLETSASGVVAGRRTTTPEGDAPTSYNVTGYKKDSFYWLEYHLAEGRGGGAITLQEFTPGKLMGLVTSVDCDNHMMQCRANRWLPYEERSGYKPEWQSTIGRVAPAIAETVRT
jgi:hypothetical protein